MGTTTPGSIGGILGRILEIAPPNNLTATVGLVSTGGSGTQFVFGSNSSYSSGASVGFNQSVTGALELFTNGTAPASGGTGTSRMLIDQTGIIGINTKSPLGVLDVRGVGTATLNGTIPVASISGKTSFAGLVVDNSGAGDIFTASSSGLNRFVITQNGNVGYWDNVPRKNCVY